MARLPVPGSDNGLWGEILNDYLSQAHNDDGTLKSSSVPESSLDAGVQAKLNATTTVSSVTVVTGSEARPSAVLVFWIGGDTQPINMASGDVWLREPAV